MKKLAAIVMMALLSGCVAPKAFQHPGLSGEEQREAWARDYAACDEEGYRAWGEYFYKNDEAKIVSMPRVPSQSIAGMYIDKVRTRCLEAKGWVRVDLPGIQKHPETERTR
jgi:hypothetical protein